MDRLTAFWQTLFAPTSTALAQGAQALNQVAHGMVAIHNLTKLEDLASSLAKLMKQ